MNEQTTVNDDERNVPIELINLGYAYDDMLARALRAEPGDPRAEVANLDKFFLRDVVELIGFTPADVDIMNVYEFNMRDRYFRIARDFVEELLVDVIT